jgi:hypothetical protein
LIGGQFPTGRGILVEFDQRMTGIMAAGRGARWRRGQATCCFCRCYGGGRIERC